MLDVKKLADEAEVIVQGYAFIPKGEGITIIDLHKPEHAAYFYNDEIVETSMDEIEAFKVTASLRADWGRLICTIKPIINNKQIALGDYEASTLHIL